MEIREIREKNLWEEFLLRTHPNTFLQNWNWGIFNETIGRKIFRLGVFQNGELQGVCLLIKYTTRLGNYFYAPRGPIIPWTESKIFENLLEEIKRLAEVEEIDFIKIDPLLPESEENETFFRKRGFKKAVTFVQVEDAWLLDLSKSEEELLAEMRKTTRYSIRKAEKDGVEVIKSTAPDDIEKFWRVYQSTVDRQHFVPFSKNYLRREFEIFAAQDKAILFFGQYKGEIISTAYAIFEPWSGFYHHGASISKYTSVPASQLVQWHVIEEAKQRGCVRYNFWGVVPETTKTHPWAGLSTFKRGFGGYAQEYVHAQDLIISNKYWMNWTVERMRKWRRHL